MKKPSTPAREFIAPSDLTFGFSTCKRCIWIKYWYSFELKKDFPLVKSLSTFQEEYFRRAPMPALDPSLPAGTVKQWGQWVKSKNIVVNGVETQWKLRGIYDLLGHYDDGTVGIIDCKVSDSERDSGQFYSPQLEAYAYSLENPAAGRAQSVASMGLLVWKPTHAVGDSLENYGFGVFQKYLPVERDQANFLRVIGQFIEVLEGDLPDSGPTCTTCIYLNERTALDNA